MSWIDEVLPKTWPPLAVSTLGIASMAVLLTAGAAVTVPMYPVPMTLQTLSLCVLAAVLGPLGAGLGAAAYLLLGLSGLPVFAGWTSLTPGELLDAKSGGYLAAFTPAAVFCGWLSLRRAERRLVQLVVVMLGTHLIVLAIGASWLARFLPAGAALEFGVWPFIPGALVKSLMAAGIVSVLHRLAPGRAIAPI